MRREDEPPNDTAELELRALAQRVRRLEQREAIADLYSAYSWLVDTGRWRLVADEIFTSDSTLVLGAGLSYVGRPEIHGFYEATAGGLDGTGHFITNLKIDIEDGENASARAYFQSYHWSKESNGDAMRPADFVGVGVYVDRLVWEGDRWRIKSRRRELLGPGPLGHGVLPHSIATTLRGWGVPSDDLASGDSCDR